MKFGLYGINIGPFVDPEVAARVARAARYWDLGVDRLVLLPFARKGDELVAYVAQVGGSLVAKLR